MVDKAFITAADVAARAGVSRSAVSRTFTPGASVSSAVRSRVLKAAEQTGYRVNRLARSLIQNRSSLVGIVAANVDTPFNASLLSALSERLLQAGYQCMLLNAGGMECGIAPLIEQILEYRAHALVVLTGSPPNEVVAESLRQGLRVILINKPMPGVAVDTILSDDPAGAILAADRLIRAGRRRLAVVASGARTPSQTRRIAAFRRRARAHGVEPVVWAKGPTSYETGRRAAAELLAGGARPSGIFCVTDLLALGVLDAARHRHGVRVPEDLAVIGFDDIPAACWSSYGLTTVRQSVSGLARAVVDAVESDGHAARRVTVPVELVERHSVGPIQETITTGAGG